MDVPLLGSESDNLKTNKNHWKKFNDERKLNREKYLVFNLDKTNDQIEDF